ncbi:hypothetical protein ACPOL_5646 [Acidisarcina polymorpha]|uniref:Uncharacterized protein n=1 Tax=Acidisarcina polymorpha TaxID=2211140 RepID=A0A2Z5G863_9BACT|nr:hypothetical protein [Acidisarcina polymorpha]AXC14894.1 hypothetical protein ACPOL_5646 [Acidisarcina polymorpha]
MAQAFAEKPVEDSVAKVNNEVAVGEDLEFQRKWWKFERGVWIVFYLILLLDVLGFFGRGWVAKKEIIATDGSIDVKFERIERTSTPSILTVKFGSSAIQHGEVELYTSGSVVKELGAQRVVPSPKTTTLGQDGLTYTFPATTPPASVEFALEPTGPGIRHFVVQVPGFAPVKADIAVVP